MIWLLRSASTGVAPGGIPSDLRGPKSLAMEERSIAEIPMADYVERLLPLARMSQPEDYTGHYVLLASYANSNSATGAITNCDGGIGVRGFTQPAGGYDL